MGFWITILGSIIIGMAFSFTGGVRNGGSNKGSGGAGGSGGRNGNSRSCGSKTPPCRKSDFRENEFDDAIADFDRIFPLINSVSL